MNKPHTTQSNQQYPIGMIPPTQGSKSKRLTRTLILGSTINLIEPELARGGEGVVYRIRESTRDVAKIFHQPSNEKTAKLLEMLEHVPHDPTYERYKHISIAWPTALIARQQGNCLICIGFTMPYIDHKHSYPLLKLYNPEDRASMKLGFTWEYLLAMVRNLANILEELHKKGYVVSDLNESNILVSTKAMVTLVDCDSLQVPDPKTKGTFRCVVGKPEYTAPELQGLDFRLVDRTPNHDNFALAVLIFLMLMEGWHPFAAVWQGEGMAPSLAENIHNGIFPYTGKWEYLHPASALSFKILPPSIQKLMKQCFITAYSRPTEQRPSALKWLQALEQAGAQLVQCPNNKPTHVYSKHLKQNCPWCERMRLLNIADPFPPSHKPAISHPLPGPGWREKLTAFVARVSKIRPTAPAVCLIIMYVLDVVFLLRYHLFTQMSVWPLLVAFFLLIPVALFSLVAYILIPFFHILRRMLKYVSIYIILLIIIYIPIVFFLQKNAWFAGDKGQNIILPAFLILPLLFVVVVYLLRHKDKDA
ncbi:MAG TPA: hypothetical protein VGD98_10120 [Ktedonobacteraceae bacterium]